MHVTVVHLQSSYIYITVVHVTVMGIQASYIHDSGTCESGKWEGGACDSFGPPFTQDNGALSSTPSSSGACDSGTLVHLDKHLTVVHHLPDLQVAQADLSPLTLWCDSCTRYCGLLGV